MSDDLPETGDKAIRWFGGFFVLGAVLEGWVAWHHDEIIRALEYWSVGAVLTSIGVFWTRIRTWAGPRFSATAAHVATDFRWWVVAIISTLSLLTFSPFVEQQRWPTSWQLSAFIGSCLLLAIGSIIGFWLSGKHIQPNQKRSIMQSATDRPATELSDPHIAVILTDEERHFRIELRKFVLSNISEINHSFGYALSIPNNIVNDIENHRSNLTPNEQEKMTKSISMYNELIGVKFFPNLAPIINASQKNVEDIDLTQLASLIKKFFDGYRKTQVSFNQIIHISELDPNKTGLLEKWLSADARALNALRDLKSFPDAKVLEGIDEGYFPTRTGSFAEYLPPSRRDGGQ